MAIDLGNIQLNLVSSGSSVNFERKPAIKHKNRSDRIKERRYLKHLRSKDTDQGGQGGDDDKPLALQPQLTSAKDAREKQNSGKRKSSGTGEGTVAKKPRTGAVVSSLFKNNPDIPRVSSLAVDSVTEAVFTSKPFSDLNELHPFLVSNLEGRMGLMNMTAVQQETIPAVLEGKDVLVKSQTGSGKTLSYAVPIVQCLQAERPKLQRDDGIFAVVIVPTRELTVQSLETFQKLVYSFKWIVAGSIMGGEKKKSEKARLRKGLNILVSTPGRLLDHLLHTESMNVARMKWLVIDEADRLLDMGYEKDVSQIISILDEKKRMRQTLLLSATLTPKVEKLAGMSLNSPVFIDTAVDKSSVISCPGDEEKTFAIPESLKQHFVIVPSKLRLVTLSAFILWKCKFSMKGSKMVVFLSTQDSVEFHHRLLQETLCQNELDSDDEDTVGLANRIEVFKLHGDMEQKSRTKVYRDFVSTKSGVLLCTDVAARGLDLPNVRWIVQYNTPGSPEDYIHRVGRTARAGSKGHALLFLTPSEVEYVKVLSSYNISVDELNMDDVLKTLLIPSCNIRKKKGDASQSIEQSATSLQLTFEACIQNSTSLTELARKAFLSYIRAYSTYPSKWKHIFHLKKLHLGHAAKAFALREAPTAIGHYSKKIDMKQSRSKSLHEKRKPKTFAHKPKIDLSEFASGLEDGITKKRKLAKIKETRR